VLSYLDWLSADFVPVTSVCKAR